MRLKKLAKMKDLGIKAKELQICLEKRYEQILVNFNSSVEVFKQTIASLLKEQQKEIFSAIQLEKT